LQHPAEPDVGHCDVVGRLREGRLASREAFREEFLGGGVRSRQVTATQQAVDLS
jgi:hypothetical protein